MGRHAFPARFADAPSIQPERIPAHRAPQHRAAVPVDLSPCGLVACTICDAGELTIGAHRADRAVS